MALDFRTVSVPFNQGLDTKTDDKLVLPGKLIDLKNGVFQEGGKIKKRQGFSRLSKSDILNSTTFTEGSEIQSFGDELILYAANQFNTYSLTSDGWLDKGDMISFKVSSKTIIDNNYKQTQQDMAVNDNVVVHAWRDERDSGSIRATVYDNQTGAEYQTDVQISATGTRPRVIAILNLIFIWYADGADLKYKRLLCGIPQTFESEVTVKADLDSTDNFFDVDMYSDNLLVTYHDSSNEIHVFYWLPVSETLGSIAGGTGDEVTFTGETVTHALALSVMGDTSGSPVVVVAFYNSTDGLKAIGRNGDLTSKFTVVTLDSDVTQNVVNLTGRNIVESETMNWFYEKDATEDQDHFVKKATHSRTGADITAAVLLRSVGLGFEAFRVGTTVSSGARIYFGTVHQSDFQSTYFIHDVDGVTIGKIHQAQAGGFTEIQRLPRPHNISDEKWVFSSLKKGRLQLEDGTFFNLSGVNETQFDFDALTSYDSDELGDSLHIGGAQVWQYDNSQIVENGFHLYPENVSLAQSASGGSMSDGTYSVRAVYEWIDSEGQRHRSNPSPAVSIVVNGGGSSQTITATVPTLRITAKSNITIHLYSTEASGTIYYRVTTVTSPTFNDKTVDTVDIDRTIDDTDLLDNEILYTTGGIIENIGPPAASIVESHNNRIYLSGLENANEFWYSKEFIQGEAVSFSDVFVRRVEQDGGPITQLQSMDDKLLIFKENRVYFQAGGGPNLAGLNSDFTEPQLITTDVGCIQPRSVVLMPRGVMFKSDKGIYLLDRSLNVHYIGADVEDFNGETITGSVLIEGDNEVRFTTRSGMALVYNYYFNQWSTFTNYSSEGSALWLGTYTHLKANGTVNREIDEQFLDNGTFYNLVIETAWLKMAGLQGFQRVRGMAVLGEYQSPHRLVVTLFYDYEEFDRHTVLFNSSNVINDEYGDDATYGDSVVYGGVNNGVYQMRVPHLARQKCEAIKFRFEDQPNGSDVGQSFSINDLTLYVGMKRGLVKLPAAKTL